jgi:hypothetical protein
VSEGRTQRVVGSVKRAARRGRQRARAARLARNPPPPDPPPSSASGADTAAPPPPTALERWVGDASPTHLTLDDLPVAVADELRFDVAAPRALRAARMPPEVRATFRYVWDGVIADVYDELRGESRTAHLRRATVKRILERVGVRLQQSQVALIVAGVHYPFPGNRSGVATAGLTSAGLAGTEGIIAYTSAGTAAAGAVGAAIMGELLEVYLAASARTHQYERFGRSPSAERIVEDLAEVYGAEGRAGRRTSVESVQWALRQLARRTLPRTGTRFFRALVPGVGMAVSGAFSVRDVRRVLAVPVAPVDVEEAERLRRQALDDPASYEESVRRLLELFEPPPPPEPPARDE